MLLARTNRADEAIKIFEQALSQGHGHLQAAYNLAVIYVSRKEYERAIPLLERTLTAEGGPEAVEMTLLLTLVDAYAHVNRKQEALKLSEIIERRGGGDLRVLFTLGLALADSGAYERAAELFSRTNELRPNTYEVLYNLGVAYFNLDHLDEARKVLQDAATLRPDEADGSTGSGWLRCQRRKRERPGTVAAHHQTKSKVRCGLFHDGRRAG